LPGYGGFLLAKEVNTLSKIFTSEARPLTFIVGGGKATTKAKFLQRIVEEADFLMVGGVLANIFLKVQGYKVGRSVADAESVEFVKHLKFKPNQLILPEDFVVAPSIDEHSSIRTVDYSQVADNEYILDIGPKSIKKFDSIIQKSKTVVWNGPLGYYELARFAQGTHRIAEILVESKAKKIIGGGDLVGVLSELVTRNKFNYVSTGGGAMLEFLAGEKLPGLEALGYYNKN